MPSESQVEEVAGMLGSDRRKGERWKTRAFLRGR